MPRACERGPLALAFCVFLAASCGAVTRGTTDDPTISTHVKIALLNDPLLGALRLDAKTFQGTVTLFGTVSSQAEVDRAIAAARKVAGARNVKSELKIVP